MRISKAIFFITISLSLFALAGCSDPKPAANTVLNSPANTVVKTNSAPANSEFEGQKKPEDAKTNDAQSIVPVVNAYYNALKSKDEAALRKIYSQAAIKELETHMKSEGRKSIAEYITASEPVSDKPYEVRNEKIEGDSAIAEIKGGSYASWIKWKFVKENGEWKKAAPSEDLKLFGK